MKKLFPVLLGLMLPLASAMADNFVDAAVAFCRSHGGAYAMADMVAEGDQYCRQVRCTQTTSDRLEIPAGAPGPEANVEATKKVCVPKSTIDGNFEPGRTASGTPAGAGGGTPAGAGGGTPAGAGGGTPAGAGGGTPAGAGGGSVVIGANDMVCITTSGEVIIPGICHDACKPTRGFLGLGRRRADLERKSCVECMMGQGYDFPDDVKRRVGISLSTRPGGGRAVVATQTICYDSNNVRIGRIVNGTCVRDNNGGTTVITGSGAAGGNGGITVVTGGSVAAGGNGGSTGLPSICQSTRRSDQEACDLWIRNNARFQCSQGGRCIDEGRVTSRYDRDCVNCGPGARQQSTLSGIAEIAGAIAPPLAALGIGYFQSRAQERSAQAWAGAASVGFEQCQISQNNYLQYTAANELPGITPEQQRQMGCNGFGLGQFAGMGGQYGGLYGAGYSPGFVGGMMGPYGGYNPYGGMGGMAGGFAGGFAGGMQGGMYPGGFQGGGFAQGISLAGGMAGGMYNGGMQGGMYPAGGMYASGGMYQGGFQGGMYPAGGMAGGMYAGGMQGGMYQGGFQGGGFAQGISLAGGIAGGMYQGGMQGGMYQGGYNPYGGGMGGVGGWGSGVGTGYGYPGAGGGYFGGAGGFGGNMGALSAQTSNYDAMLQQRGLAYNMGQMSQGGMGGYGAAAYSPMNMGGQLGFGGQFGFGGQVGGGFY